VYQSIGQRWSQLITGLAGSGRTLFLASLLKEQPRQILIVAQNLFHANQMMEDLTGIVSEEQLHLFPADEAIHAEMAFASPETRAERIATLTFLMSGKPGIVVVPLSGVRKILPPKEVLTSAYLTVRLGTDLELSQTAAQLVAIGYQREQMVASPGEFSIRGGILDIY